MDDGGSTFALIVGGGPVGLTLALDLGRRNVPTVLVSDQAVTAQNPKCNFITIKSMEYYRRLGVSGRIHQASHDSGIVPRIAFRTRFNGHEFCHITVPLPNATEWPSPERFQRLSQIWLEPILKSTAESQASVDLRFSCRASDIAIDEHGGRATITDLATGKQQMLRSRYIVGCDGARSDVRKLIGAELVGKDGTKARKFMSKTKLIYFIRSPDLTRKCPHPPAAQVWILNKDTVGFVLCHDDEDGYIVQYQLPADVRPDDVDTASVLRDMLGPDVEYTLISMDCWEGGIAKVADLYRKGPVFVAGDAAHTLPPLAGLAMNTGIDDAINLSWKLAANYHGWAGENLLDSYEEERQEMAVRNSIIGVHVADLRDRWVVPDDINSNLAEGERQRREFGQFLMNADQQVHGLLGAHLGGRYASSIIVEPSEVPDSDPWIHYEATDNPGGRLPHLWLDDDTALYDRLGDWFSLLVFREIDTDEFEKLAATRKLPLAVIRLTRHSSDFRRGLVLVRPDLYIAWSGDEFPDDPLTIIDRARGNLI